MNEKKQWQAPGLDILDMAETASDTLFGDNPDGLFSGAYPLHHEGS